MLTDLSEVIRGVEHSEVIRGWSIARSLGGGA